MDDCLDFKRRLVAAWEACRGGREVPTREIEKWLHDDMWPIINEARDDLAKESRKIVNPK